MTNKEKQVKIRAKRENASFRQTEKIINNETDFGLRKYGNKKKFRSSYEYGFVVYLDELKIRWEFEKHGEMIENFSGTKVHYIPDFFLPEYNCYIEIVNNMDSRLRNKLYCFQTQYTNKKLFVLDRKSLRDMFDSKFTIYDVIGKKI